MRLAFLTALALAVLPGQALAQQFFGPFPPVQEEYGPGITVSGIGLSRVTMPTRVTEESAQQAVDAARPRSAARGMADARRRAAATAAPRAFRWGRSRVELDTQFADTPPCRRSRRTGELRCRIPAFITASAEVTFEIAGGPTSSEDARELTATGVGSAPVDSPLKTSPSIRHSLFAARLAVTPNAAAAARRNVELAAWSGARARVAASTRARPRCASRPPTSRRVPD